MDRLIWLVLVAIWLAFASQNWAAQPVAGEGREMAGPSSEANDGCSQNNYL
jgi:hypothetical protein